MSFKHFKYKHMQNPLFRLFVDYFRRGKVETERTAKKV